MFRLQSSSLSLISSPWALPVVCQSLPEAIPEGIQRFWLQSRWLSFYGSAPAQLGQVSTNTWCCRAGCGQLQACLRKTCYHSTTLAILTGFENQKVLMLCHCKFWEWQVTNSIFFKSMWHHFSWWISWEFVTDQRAVQIAWLNLTIIHCSLSKNKAQIQICMLLIDSCAKQQIPFPKRASAQTSPEQHSQFRLLCAKACRQSLPWFWLQICCKWNFRFKEFFSNLPLKTIICRVTDRPSITRFSRSVIFFKFSLLTFLRLMTCLGWGLSKKCVKRIFNYNLSSGDNICQSKVLGQEFWCILSDLNVWPLSNLKMQISMTSHNMFFPCW